MDVIREYENPDTARKSSLISLIPCLVNTIAFLHRNCIKHVDIEPRNIFVRRNRNNIPP